MINPKMQYEKKKIEVLGKKMAYVDTGEGDPLVFFHGNITSSFMYRNIMPHLESFARCIAVDNIGQGDSDKLEGSMYRLKDHQQYIDGFMEAMVLEENVTIMVHDWGAQLGFTWANGNRGAIKGIAQMQGVIGNFVWSHWPEKVQILFKRFRSPEGEELVLGENYFVENILPAMTLRDLTEEEMNEYRRPYKNPGEDRRPTLTWPREIPIEGYPSDVLKVIEENNAWLSGSPLPKLFINSEPGAVLVGEHREMVRSWPNLTETTVRGLHYIHEDSPGDIGRALADWYKSLG
jgi:haloalkane dehalogenase